MQTDLETIICNKEKERGQLRNFAQRLSLTIITKTKKKYRIAVIIIARL